MPTLHSERKGFRHALPHTRFEENQLFNSKWMEQRSADSEPGGGTDREGAKQGEESRAEGQDEEGSVLRGKVLAFPSNKENDPV